MPKTRSRATGRKTGLPKQQPPSLRLHAEPRVGSRPPGRGWCFSSFSLEHSPSLAHDDELLSHKTVNQRFDIPCVLRRWCAASGPQPRVAGVTANNTNHFNGADLQQTKEVMRRQQNQDPTRFAFVEETAQIVSDAPEGRGGGLPDSYQPRPEGQGRPPTPTRSNSPRGARVPTPR